MVEDAHAEWARVTVRGLNQRLQLTGWHASWLAKGAILPPIHTLPGGKILAVVNAPETDPKDLVLWSKEGRELARTPLALAGDVVASRVFDKRLIIASAGEVVEYDIDKLRPDRTRKLPVSSEKTVYAAGPTGLWVVTDRALSYFDLDGGASMTRTRPLVSVSDKPACSSDPSSIKEPCSAGFQPNEAEMLVSDTGEMLIIDVYLERYPISTTGVLPDQVWPSAVTVLDSRGNIAVQKPYSWMKTKREWFWTQGGSPQSGGPADWGLVRTRYVTDSIAAGRLFASRGSDFLYWSGRDEMVIHRWNRLLKPVWKQSIRDLAGGFISSPSWVSPMLLHDHGCYRFSTISDQGRSKREQLISIDGIAEEQQKTHYERPRFAIGQSAEGDWLLIAY